MHFNYQPGRSNLDQEEGTKLMKQVKCGGDQGNPFDEKKPMRRNHPCLVVGHQLHHHHKKKKKKRNQENHKKIEKNNQNPWLK